MSPCTPLQTPAYWICLMGTVALLGCALILGTDRPAASTAVVDPFTRIDIARTGH
ncbi:MAG: hypothetical protein JXQ99_05150 [Hyphomicrobiaceae bacterium]